MGKGAGAGAGRVAARAALGTLLARRRAMSIRSALRILSCAFLPSIILASCAPPPEADAAAAALAIAPPPFAAAGADWSSLGGTLTSAPVVARNSDNKLEVFVVGGN